MSEFEASRPRRALAPDDEAIRPDDTPPTTGGGARRGAAPEEAAEAVSEAPVNPFARPGSREAGQAVPEAPTPPVVPVPEDEPQSVTTAGRRGLGASEEAGPAPRRSAASSTSPTELMIPAPRSGATPTQPHWARHHRRAIAIWVVAALLAAGAVVGGVYLLRRTLPAPEPTPSPTVSGPTQSAPTPTIPALQEQDLFTAADAQKMVPDGAWAVTKTATEPDQADAQAACLGTISGGPNPVHVYQRTLGTTNSDHLAALHQVDIYANEKAAQQVQAERMKQLAACSEVPARILAVAKVEGFADEAWLTSIAYENDPLEAHVLLVARSGKALTIVDAARDGGVVAGEAVTSSAVRSQQAVCKAAGGTCPSKARFVRSSVLPTEPAGWLVPSDLPRLTAGTGLWVAEEPGTIKGKGTGCENMTLASVSGPRERQQATYVLTQDDRTPEGFGLDVMHFTFDKADGATKLHKQLADNLASCKQRLLNSEVTEHKAVSSKGQDGEPITARLFTVKQSTGSSPVLFQGFVGINGNTVYYGLANVSNEFKFSEQQLGEMALRQGDRLSLLPG